MDIEQLKTQFRNNLIEEIIEAKIEYEDFFETPIGGSEYEAIHKIYIKQRAVFWTEDEIDMTQDKLDFKLLNKDEKFFIVNILGFFAGSDVIVNENIETNFIPRITQPNILVYYNFQATIENIHSLVYSNMLKALLPPDHYNNIKTSIKSMPIVQKKADWARKWINADCSLAELLVAFKCVEGIFFSGSFCAIYWLGELRKVGKENLFRGIRKGNEFIARDESIHVLAANTIYKRHILNKLPWILVKEIFLEAVSIEKEFITEALPCKLIGMSAQKMSEYIEYVANIEMKSLGYDQQLFPARACPFTFMIKEALDKQSNFFETIETNYSKAGSSNVTPEDLNLLGNADF